MIRMRAIGVVGLVVIALVAHPPPVHAEGEVDTDLTIRPLEPIAVGTRTELVVELRVSGGEPVADEAVELFVDGTYFRRTRTDAGGLATFKLPIDLTAGTYSLSATYSGARDRFLSSSDTFTLTVMPYELVIETVPPLPGMAFSLDGARFIADEHGVARIAVDRAGERVLRVLDEEHATAALRAEFSRWNTELFGPEITVTIPLRGPLQAGFDLYRPASQVFVDLDGEPVDSDRVRSMTLRSSLGHVYTYPDGTARFYKASRAVRRPNGLESVPVRYNVEEVEVDGSNVVNSGQQRFFVEPGGPWTISLLMYSARVLPRDALFGVAVGNAAEIIYPNGKVERIEANENGEIVVNWLARGIYRMTVPDAPGWAPAVPVALSRDQEVELRVVTYLDMAVASLVLLTIAFGLLHRGRPHLIPGLVGGAVRAIRGIPRIGGGDRPRPPVLQPVAVAERGPARIPGAGSGPAPPGDGQAEPRALLAEPIAPTPMSASGRPVDDVRLNSAVLAAVAAAGGTLPRAQASGSSGTRTATGGSVKKPPARKPPAKKPSAKKPPPKQTTATSPARARGSAAMPAASGSLITGNGSPATARRPSDDVEGNAPPPRGPRRGGAPADPPKATSSKPRASRPAAAGTIPPANDVPAASASRGPARQRASVTHATTRRAKPGTAKPAAAKTARRPTRSSSKTSATKAPKRPAAMASTATKGSGVRGRRSSTSGSATDGRARAAKTTGGATRARRTGSADPAARTRGARPGGKGRPSLPPKGAPARRSRFAPASQSRSSQRSVTDISPEEIRQAHLNIPGIGDLQIGDQTPVQPAGVAGPASTRSCANCGMSQWVGAVFCRRCGHALPGDTDDATDPTAGDGEVLVDPEPTAARRGSRKRGAA